MAVLRRNDGEQLHQYATRRGMQTRTSARCAHCEPGGCIGRFRRRLQGGRASNPPLGGQGAKGREGGGGRMCRRREGLELARKLTRYTDNVDIATYVSGLASRCIL